MDHCAARREKIDLRTSFGRRTHAMTSRDEVELELLEGTSRRDSSAASERPGRDDPPVLDASVAFGPFEQFMLAVILIGIVIVMTKMAIRDYHHQWKNCDPDTVLSKHEYCFNVTNVHILSWST